MSDSSPFPFLSEQHHIAGDRFCVANRVGEGTALANRCDPPKADGEDCLRFLPDEA